MKHPFYVYAMRDERDGSGSYDIQADVRVTEDAWVITPTEHVHHYVNILLGFGRTGLYCVHVHNQTAIPTAQKVSIHTDTADKTLTGKHQEYDIVVHSPWDQLHIIIEFTDTFTPVVFAPVYLAYVRGLTTAERVRNFINTF